ncbi:DNA mismatch repair protein MutS [Nocardia sp. NPDC005978]|uniref:MutS-related protein n=1 Tax=Nocardia sp. NPDC005978 TaxID=3156725 RepID=UPI0033A54AEC
MRADSVLWPDGSAGVAEMVVEPETVADLNLDQVIAAVLRDGHEYELDSVFRRPVRDLEVVRYRQEVFADLGSDAVRRVFDDFAAGMRRMWRRLAGAEKLTHPLQQQRWRLDAAAEYVTAVAHMAAELADLELTSRALRRWRAFLDFSVAGSQFGRLAEDVREVQRALATVRYSIRLIDGTVEVGAAGDDADYSATVADLVSRFGAGPPPAVRRAGEWADMNQMEEQILDRVVALRPEAFARLTEFAARHRDFADLDVVTFDREIHFYLLYLDFARGLAADGRTMCLPELASGPAEVRAERAFDLALANRRRGSDQPLVCNDFQLSGPERILVVTGPNQGGKTTFARMVGQLAYLAALGCPVPAASARLPLPDRLTTHFERAEQATDTDGRLLAELERMRDTLEHATADSVIVLNESFSSTSTVDGVRIGLEVLRQIIARGSIAVWVTFFDELAHAGPETVSMVAVTEPDDSAQRTFRIVRRPADGNAHAVVLAERYGLTYERVTARIAR